MKSLFTSQAAWKRLSGALVALALAATLVMLAPTGGVSAAPNSPSGERVHGNSTVEPGYDISGKVVYVNTPANAGFNPNPHGWAPFYLPMYPLSAASSVGVMQCAHSPMDNCPDHGPEVAAAAEQIMPAVYGDGVWGHDHLFAAPGSGGDFNIAWEPVLVLFTNSDAANTHITTLAQLNALLNSGDIIEIPLPTLTFHCSIVGAGAYNHSTPVTPVPGT